MYLSRFKEWSMIVKTHLRFQLILSVHGWVCLFWFKTGLLLRKVCFGFNGVQIDRAWLYEQQPYGQIITAIKLQIHLFYLQNLPLYCKQLSLHITTVYMGTIFSQIFRRTFWLIDRWNRPVGWAGVNNLH